MVANATAVWRTRPSGNNNNGAGYDCAISAAATGTHGSLSGVTFTDATASAFTSGMAGRSINIEGVGQYKIATFVSATQITLTVGSGGVLPQLSGGMSWTVGSGTDYSQQNAAQVTQSGGTVSTATTTLTDTGASFTSALIGNGIRVAGTGISTTYTFITAVPSGTTLTLQTSPGTAGTSVTYSIGGGWADFVTNTTSSGPVIPGNTLYILGAGTPNPASYAPDYTVSALWNIVAADGGGAGLVTFANDPSTPGYKPWPDTTGGMPLIKNTCHGTFGNLSGSAFQGLWFYAASAVAAGDSYFNISAGQTNDFKGCVFDQNAIDVIVFNTSAGYMRLYGCEIFSSSGGTGGSNFSCIFGSSMCLMDSCNVHDTVGFGVRTTSIPAAILVNTIVANCGGGIGIDIIGNSANAIIMVKNCTIDSNVIGIRFNSGFAALNQMIVANNIVSNNSSFGFQVGTSTAAQSDQSKLFIDYNIFYNNGADLQNISYGAHDTHGGSNPYVGQSTENFALA